MTTVIPHSVPSISVLIVNYNTEAYLSHCLASLLQQTGIQLQVIVVDNCSQQAEQIRLQQYASQQITIIQSEVNLGFGRANNLAADSATGEYLLILNPDTRLLMPDTLQRMIATMANSGHAMLSPLIDEPEKGKHVTPRYKYPAQKYCKHTKFSALKGEIAWVLGACMLIKRSDYMHIGGFDRDFFMYGEDTDLCLRIRKQIGSIGFAPDIVIEHIGGASEKQAPTLEKWTRKRRGAFLFYQKHYHPRDVRMIMQRKRFNAYLTIGMGWIKQKLALNTASSEQAQVKAYATLQAMQSGTASAIKA